MALRTDRTQQAADRSTIGEPFELVLAAAQANAGWAFERLYRALAPVVLGYLRLQGASEPEDLTSEVFLGAFRGICGFTGSEKAFRSWVFTIAHRRLLDERRRHARRPMMLGGPERLAAEPLGGDAEEDALALLGDRRVREICGSIGPDQRDVLLLRLVAGLTVEQVSATLGRTTASVKALQRRGLTCIRRQLECKGATL